MLVEVAVQRRRPALGRADDEEVGERHRRRPLRRRGTDSGAARWPGQIPRRPHRRIVPDAGVNRAGPTRLACGPCPEGSRRGRGGRHTAAARRHIDPLPPGLRCAGGVWAVGIVRDEADIVGTVVAQPPGPRGRAGGDRRQPVHRRHPRRCSSDLARSQPVTVLADRLAAHYQAEKTTLLARAAAARRGGLGAPLRRRRGLGHRRHRRDRHRGAVAGGVRRRRGAGAGVQPRAHGGRRSRRARPGAPPAVAQGRAQPPAQGGVPGPAPGPGCIRGTTACTAGGARRRASRSDTSPTAPRSSSCARSARDTPRWPPPTSPTRSASTGAASAPATTTSCAPRGARCVDTHNLPVGVVGAPHGLVGGPGHSVSAP